MDYLKKYRPQPWIEKRDGTNTNPIVPISLEDLEEQQRIISKQPSYQQYKINQAKVNEQLKLQQDRMSKGQTAVGNTLNDLGTGILTWGTELRPPTQQEKEKNRYNVNGQTWLNRSASLARAGSWGLVDIMTAGAMNKFSNPGKFATEFKGNLPIKNKIPSENNIVNDFPTHKYEWEDEVRDKIIKESKLAKEFLDKWTFGNSNIRDISAKEVKLNEMMAKIQSMSKKPSQLTPYELSEISNLTKQVKQITDELPNQILDPVLESKIKNIFNQDLGIEVKNLPRTGPLELISDKTNIVFVNESDPSFVNLSDDWKQYIRQNVKGIRGFSDKAGSVTFGSIPEKVTFTQTIKVPNQNRNFIDKLLHRNKFSNSLLLEQKIANKYFSIPEITNTIVHEGGHDIQKIANWGNQIRKYDPELKYFTANLETKTGQKFRSVMGSPSSNDPIDIWKSSPAELHSDLMGSRFRLLKHLLSTGRSFDRSMNIIKSDSDKVLDWFLNDKEIRKFFTITSTPEQQKEILKLLPGLVPAAVGLSQVPKKQGGGNMNPKDRLKQYRLPKTEKVLFQKELSKINNN